MANSWFPVGSGSGMLPPSASTSGSPPRPPPLPPDPPESPDPNCLSSFPPLSALPPSTSSSPLSLGREAPSSPTPLVAPPATSTKPSPLNSHGSSLPTSDLDSRSEISTIHATVPQTSKISTHCSLPSSTLQTSYSPLATPGILPTLSQTLQFSPLPPSRPKSPILLPGLL